MVSIPVIKYTVETSLMKPVMLQLNLEFEDTGESKDSGM